MLYLFTRWKREVIFNLERIVQLLERLFGDVDYFIVIGGIVDIKQGQATLLTAVPKDTVGNVTTLPKGDVPTWTVTDASAVDVTPSADGLTLTVAVHANAPAEDVVFEITDSVIPTAKGSFTLTILAPPPPPPPAAVASFDVSASAPTP